MNGATPSEAGRNNVNAMIEGLPGAERVHVLYDEPVDVPLARSNNEIAVRVVGSPWTSYDTKGREHLSYSHHWRPESGGIFGGATLQLYEERMDCKAWWQDHWARIGQLLEARETLDGVPIGGSILVTHTPPRGILDIVGGHKDKNKKSADRHFRVGDEVLKEMLEDWTVRHYSIALAMFTQSSGMTSRRKARGSVRRSMYPVPYSQTSRRSANCRPSRGTVSREWTPRASWIRASASLCPRPESRVPPLSSTCRL